MAPAEPPRSSTPDPVALGQRLVSGALARGFALAGICPALPSGRAADFREWLAQGGHGDMAFMTEYVAERLDPGRLLPGARSMLLVADRYAAHDGRAPSPAPGHGRIARYAQGRDYHAVIKKRLHALADALRPAFPGAAFRSFADTAPVLEREHAVRAGLGWVGKHTLVIHPALGSYFVLGGILTTLDAAPPPETGPDTTADRCGTCTRCIDACPTSAITPYRVDATRCISYLTIERRGTISADLATASGEWLFGCDVCQEVCPYNQPRADGPPGSAPLSAYTPRRSTLEALGVLAWTRADRTRELSGSAMKRATLDMLKRNALVVIARAWRTTGDQRLRAALDRAAGDEALPDWVRAQARL